MPIILRLSEADPDDGGWRANEKNNSAIQGFGDFAAKSRSRLKPCIALKI
jgi:hypothetical protein